MTHNAWYKVTKAIIYGYNTITVIRDNLQWAILEFLDGFVSHYYEPRALKIWAERNILSAKEGSKTSHVNHAYDKFVAKNGMKILAETLFLAAQNEACWQGCRRSVPACLHCVCHRHIDAEADVGKYLPARWSWSSQSTYLEWMVWYNQFISSGWRVVQDRGGHWHQCKLRHASRIISWHEGRREEVADVYSGEAQQVVLSWVC